MRHTQVAPCTIEQCQKVEDFKRLYDDYYNETLDRADVYRARLAHDPDLSILVASDGLKLLGVLFVFFDPAITKLTDLVVSEGFRKRGIGEQLLSEAETRIKARGGIAINAYVDHGNDASLRLLTRVGLGPAQSLPQPIHCRAKYLL